MPRLELPSLSERKKAGFAARGLKIVESISPDEFERVITAYLSTHNVLHLATCSENEPRSTTLEYFNNGLTVYLLSEGGGKLANIRKNPRVSYTVADPYSPAEDYFGAAGLQAWGTATVFQKNDDPEEFQRIHAFSGTGEGLKKQGLDRQAARVNLNVIAIEPEKIRYLNYRAGFRKAVWMKE